MAKELKKFIKRCAKLMAFLSSDNFAFEFGVCEDGYCTPYLIIRKYKFSGDNKKDKFYKERVFIVDEGNKFSKEDLRDIFKQIDATFAHYEQEPNC